MARIVMIVDNSVRGDSRVLKTAMSVAEAGHEVFLLGRLGDASLPDDFELPGGARVMLLRSPLTQLAGVKRAPRWSPRYPVAFTSAEVRGVRLAQMESRQRMHREFRERATQVRDVPGWRVRVSKARLTMASGWFRLRDRQFRGLVRFRSAGTSRWLLWRARMRVRLNPQQGWVVTDPGLSDYEMTFGPAIDDLAPDLVHAHDFRMVGVAARAVLRGRNQGRTCAFVYDAHEFLPGIRRRNPLWHVANEAQESAYVPLADAVITVSDELAGMLQERHGLRERPSVVLNAPEAHRAAASDGPERPEPPGQGVRERAGVPEGAPLVVYHGSPARQRGLETVVQALGHLPDFHAVFVLPNGAESAPYLDEPVQQAGVAERVHFLSYVPHDQVVDFLRSADLGVIPIEHDLNHEIALITKFFDYALAGLPIVVSDVRTMSATVREHGIGTVFVAGDADDCARALREAYEARADLAARYTPELLEGWTWEAQVPSLLAAYRRAAPWLDSVVRPSYEEELAATAREGGRAGGPDDDADSLGRDSLGDDEA